MRTLPIKVLLLAAYFFIFVLSGCHHDSNDSEVSAPRESWLASFDGEDWLYRQKMTISAALADSDLSDFPVLIQIDDPGNPVFTAAAPDGIDIVFTSADGSTELFHEIEAFDPQAGLLAAWVRLPLLSGDTDTDLYLYYGNSAVVSPMENPYAVWDNHYQLVYHLGPSLVDSTGNSTPSSTNTTNTDGKMGTAQAFNGGDAHIHTGWGDDPAEAPENMTFSCWVYSQYLPDTSDDEGIIHKTQGGMLSWSHKDDPHRGAFTVKASEGGWQAAKFNIDVDDIGTWIYLVGTYESGSLRAYKNGDLITENTVPAGAPHPDGSQQAVTIGKHSFPDLTEPEHHFGGDIDEVRLSDIPRNPAWIKASFRNQSAPSSYQALGAEERF